MTWEDFKEYIERMGACSDDVVLRYSIEIDQLGTFEGSNSWFRNTPANEQEYADNDYRNR